ncbi:MAG: 2-phosphosulfolactate phosphatase [Ignavibacteria bacterium]|nr:2-phosphosulfolactate phosphatase [Ignavibacteria bacterium]
MKIDAYLTPNFIELEGQFNNNIVVLIDVLRASTTICVALNNGAKDIIIAESIEKASKIYGSLVREVRFLGGERNGIKPNGFDGGNSPLDYTPSAIKGRTIILSTSNGTKLFLKARQAKVRIIGAFVNNKAVLEYIYKFIKESDNVYTPDIAIMCAGTNGRLSYEDTLCAGSYIDELFKFNSHAQLTDSAHAARDLFNLHSSALTEFLKKSEHAIYLQQSGFASDLELALTFDSYPVVPLITASTVKIFDGNIPGSSEPGNINN